MPLLLICGAVLKSDPSLLPAETIGDMLDSRQLGSRLVGVSLAEPAPAPATEFELELELERERERERERELALEPEPEPEPEPELELEPELEAAAAEATEEAKEGTRCTKRHKRELTPPTEEYQHVAVKEDSAPPTKNYRINEESVAEAKKRRLEPNDALSGSAESEAKNSRRRTTPPIGE